MVEPGNAREVEVTSEDSEYPIESALIPRNGQGWKAARPGSQGIRLFFDTPQRLQLIRAVFTEEHRSRMQEFVLRWSDGSHPSKEIVRQQYNFVAGSIEVEKYTVDLESVSILELEIEPAKGSTRICASLTELRLR